ncbi:MAG TPA: phosphate ABC transporter permease subunit PstC [Nitrospirae bacterium]|nr:phosphate transport system permease protein PstC [bacterium BMS3Abin06]HDH11060.1 phosphate ABC transporter permease subunit PstC [Nitrospirota bacterium]HDZ03057.1 phosphate ABC transporter permease subunit PstC [Nitrospirota bacterium]
MKYSILIFAIIILSAIGFYSGRSRSSKTVNGEIRKLHSLPGYYGFYVALWCGLPAVIILGIWLAFQSSVVTSIVVSGLPPEIQSLPEERMSLVINDIINLAHGIVVSRRPDEVLLAAAEHYNRLKATGFLALVAVVMSICLAGLGFSMRYINPAMRARIKVEQTVQVLMILCSTVAIFTTIGIVLSVFFESVRFFNQIPVTDFLFGLHWSPQIAIREDQVGASGSFGIIPLLIGTLMISAIAMLVAVPVGLMSAIYMSEYAAEGFRIVVKPLLEILAGIPTVVYGFFAALIVAPFLRDVGSKIGLDVSSESALAAGLVMGIMIIPFISSLSDDVINAVPQSLRDASLGIGATRSETIVRVLLPAALPGIVGSILLAVSRAIGETMIVVMAAGLTARLTANPLEAVTTFTVQIVTLLIGDQEFDSPKTLAAFALGLVLFIITLCLNIIALYVVRRYREEYE